MKRLFTLLCVSACMLTAMAQRQIQNPSFEDWDNEESTSIEPTHWNSFMSGTGSMKSFAAAQQVQKGDDAHSGNFSARIYARSVFGVVAQGNLTTGCINMGSTSATDANGNYNYTNEDDADFHQKFTGLPDAMRVWVKGSCAYPAGASCNLHTTGYFQDPAGNTITATRIAKANTSEIACTDEWQEVIIPFVYDVTDGTRPAYALITLTTSGTPGQGNANDYMFVDDVEFLYYSDLRAVTFNGKDIPFTGTTVNIDGTYDETLLQLKSGQGATISSYYAEASKTLTVSITGEDIAENPGNKHTYTIVFSGKENEKPEPQPDPAISDFYGSLVPFGDFEQWKDACGESWQNGRNEMRQRPGTEPEGWNGSSINLAGLGFFGTSTIKAEVVFETAGVNGEGKAVKLQNTYKNDITLNSAGNYVPAFVSYGTPWNYVTYYNKDRRNGGVYGGRKYTQRPDAIRGQFKRTTPGGEEKAHIIAYLWKGTFKSKIGAKDTPEAEQDDVDEAIMGRIETSGGDGQLIASCDYEFEATKDNDWETITVPLTYVEGQEEAVPEKMNIIISSADYWTPLNTKQNNTLEADDIEFLFFSSLATAAYNGQEVVFNEEGFAEIDADYEAELLQLTSDGRSATIATSYNEDERLLTITVSGGNVAEQPENIHTYKIHFLPQVKVISERTYTDLIQISVNQGDNELQNASITMQEWNTGETDLVLKNFRMGNINSPVNVGTIVVKGLQLDTEGKFQTECNTAIQAGDSPEGVQWLGPVLGEVPLQIEGQELRGRDVPDSLHVHIVIDLKERMSQYIEVLFGKSLIDAQQQEGGGDGPQPGPGKITLPDHQDYEDDLVVTLNGSATAPQKTIISVDYHKNNNTLDLVLKNFCLANDGDIMPVGTIRVKNVPYTLKNGVAYATFKKDVAVTIEEGDDPNVTSWTGPLLGDIPITLAGKAGTDKLYCTIDINMTGVGTIHVEFGKDADWPKVDDGGGDEHGENPILRDFTYHDGLVVRVNGVRNADQEADLQMTVNEDGTINLSLKNFVLITQDGNRAPLGNIELRDIVPMEVKDKDYYMFATNETITIQDGDDSELYWLGSQFGEIPVAMSGKIAQYKLYCTISTFMDDREESIIVVFGENFTDGISEVQGSGFKVQDAAIYNVSGQRLSRLQKGVNIVSGKKILVK